MVSAINTALTGLAAAEKRLGAAANNIANQHSTRRIENGTVVNEPYQRQEVLQTSLEVGGVKTETVASQRPPQQVFDPLHPDADASGLVSLPNIDMAEEIVNAQIATYDYKANLKVIKKQDDMLDNLLNIIT